MAGNIRLTSSKGNQEKWYDSATNCWNKLDQFGYEALTETLVSIILKRSNIEADTPFTFVRYRMKKFHVNNRERIGCVSENFLQPGESLVTVNHLLTKYLGVPLNRKLMRLTSNKKRIVYLAEAVKDLTGLAGFPRYLTLLFEVDALICNDDRHLNNIAVIERDETYRYCPIFDNGAGLLSNTQILRMDIAPKALVGSLRASPFNTSFARQTRSAQNFYGSQLVIPKFSANEIRKFLQPMLMYYAERDRGLITDRVVGCLL